MSESTSARYPESHSYPESFALPQWQEAVENAPRCEALCSAYMSFTKPVPGVLIP